MRCGTAGVDAADAGDMGYCSTSLSFEVIGTMPLAYIFQLTNHKRF
jgi:hypothetical protein